MSISAGRAAAASCIHHAPSSYPGIARISPSGGQRTICEVRTCPPSVSAQNAASFFTAISSGGTAIACSASLLSSFAPHASRQREARPRGRFSIIFVAARRSFNSRCKRLRTAFTMPDLRGASTCFASSTVVSIEACASVPIKTS